MSRKQIVHRLYLHFGRDETRSAASDALDIVDDFIEHNSH